MLLLKWRSQIEIND